MSDLKQQVSRLRDIAAIPITPKRRAEVLAAVESKFEGVQAVALDVIGFWAGRENFEILRQFLIDAFDREAGWSIRSVAVRNLIPLVTAKDAEWVLNLYFSRQDGLTKHELVPLVIALPPEAARYRLVLELGRTDPLNRQAAVKAIGNMAFPGPAGATLAPSRGSA